MRWERNFCGCWKDKLMRKSRAFLGLAAVILVLSGAYIFACHSSCFLVSEIKIRGNTRIPADEMTEKLKACLDENIFRLDLDEVENKLKEDIRLKSLRAERRLPGCILVEAEEKAPLLWVNRPARATPAPARLPARAPAARADPLCVAARPTRSSGGEAKP